MARYRMENLPQFRRMPKPRGNFRDSAKPAYVIVGYTPKGRPVASLPLTTREGAEKRLTTWRRKGYRISAVLEFDYV